MQYNNMPRSIRGIQGLVSYSIERLMCVTETCRSSEFSQLPLAGSRATGETVRRGGRAGRPCLPRSARNAKRIENAEAPVYYNAVLHVVRPKRIAIGVDGRGSDHRAIWREVVTLGKCQARLMCLDGDRLDVQQA